MGVTLASGFSLGGRVWEKVNAKGQAESASPAKHSASVQQGTAGPDLRQEPNHTDRVKAQWSEGEKVA